MDQSSLPASATSETEPAPDAERELGSLVAAGLKWSLISTILGRIMTPITSIVLAHLLAPAEFGVFSVALVVQTAMLSFNDLGVGNAIVWWQGDVKVAARTATTLAVGVSGVLFAICFTSAPFIAEAMRAPQATGVLRLLAVSVIIDGMSSVPIGLLNREFRQRGRAGADWLSFIVSTSLTIGLASAGFGAWSLAWGRVAGNLVSAATLYVLASQRPRPGWDPVIARTFVRFGLPLAGSSFFVFAMLNIDYIVVGRVLGPTELGIYTIAFNLSSWPPNVLSVTIRRVSIPAFARLQFDHWARRITVLAGIRNLMLITLLLSAGLFSLAGPVIDLLYPDEYQAAAGTLAVLAILGATRVLLDFMYDFLVGIGRIRPLFVLQAMWAGLLIVGLSIGATHGGIRGVAIAHVAIALGVMVPAFLLVLSRAEVPARLVASQVARPALAAAVGAAAARFVVGQASSDVVAFLVGGTTLVGVYALTAAHRDELRTLPRRLLRFEAKPVDA